MTGSLNTVELGKVCTKIGVGLAMAVTPFMTEFGVKLIRNQNIRPNKFDDSSVVYLDPEFAAIQRNKTIRESDVVIVRTGANIGDACVVPKSFDGSQSFTTLLARPDKNQLHPHFLAQFVNSEFGRSEVERLMAGGGKENLNSGELERFRITLLPIKEQQQVADVLLCWDAAIERTEQLIAAKERSQKGLMQRLLYDGAPLYRLSDFVDRVTRKNATGNNHPLTISGKDGLVSQSQYFDKRIAAETTAHYTLLTRGEFAYNRSYSAGYPYGAIKRLNAHNEGIVSSLYLCFALKEEAPLLSDYLAYYCEAGGFNHQIHRYAQEGARNHGMLNVATSDFFAMTLPLPSLEQQTRVVNILNSSAQELALLRNSLRHLREQKRGLMQKLLTGQWRIKPSSSKE